ASEEVGQVEAPGLLRLHRIPRSVAGEEGVAVETRKPLGAARGEHLVEGSVRAAVAVGDEDTVVGALELPELGVDGRSDVRRQEMELRREAADGDVAPPVETHDGKHLTGESA